LNGFTISQPGAYIVNSNLTGVSGQRGIIVNASNVTIDLQGFELVGVSGSLVGIDASDNLTVRNGTIRNWPWSGIRRFGGGNGLVVDGVVLIANGMGIDALLTTNTRVSDCRVENSSDSSTNAGGIRLGGRATVSNCVSTGNSGRGIIVGEGSTVVETTASQNGQDGIFAGVRSRLENCDASYNGYAGIIVRVYSLIRGCTAYWNGGTEIVAHAGSTIEDCTANGAGTPGHGIHIGDGGAVNVDNSTIRGCVASDNGGVEILAGARAVLEHCVADGNGSPGNGIEVGADSIVIGCTATNNGGIEILAGDRSVIESCVADGNGTAGNGIQLANASVMRGCTARNNGLTASDTEIYADDQVLIESCVADGWTGAARGAGAGIRIREKSTVRNCIVTNNLGMGIFQEFPVGGGRIEGNEVTNNSDTGIWLTGSSNVVIGNRATGNSTSNPPSNCVNGSDDWWVAYNAATFANATHPWMNIC
jgi:parallel beta-helix repeat protein